MPDATQLSNAVEPREGSPRAGVSSPRRGHWFRRRAATRSKAVAAPVIIPGLLAGTGSTGHRQAAGAVAPVAERAPARAHAALPTTVHAFLPPDSRANLETGPHRRHDRECYRTCRTAAQARRLAERGLRSARSRCPTSSRSALARVQQTSAPPSAGNQGSDPIGRGHPTTDGAAGLATGEQQGSREAGGQSCLPRGAAFSAGMVDAAGGPSERARSRAAFGGVDRSASARSQRPTGPPVSTGARPTNEASYESGGHSLRPRRFTRSSRARGAQ
jgi:hypothetical protein